MSATAFQRRRREIAAQEAAKQAPEQEQEEQDENQNLTADDFIKADGGITTTYVTVEAGEIVEPLTVKSSTKVENLTVDGVDISLSDEQIREFAKSKGIKSWHIKSIQTLQQEINELEGGDLDGVEDLEE